MLRQGRPGACSWLVISLMVTTLLTPLVTTPDMALATWSAPGLDGAQIDLSNDGYSTEIDGNFPHTDVTGAGFTPLNIAQLFLCPKNAIDLHNECLPLATAATDVWGGFPGGGPDDQRLRDRERVNGLLQERATDRGPVRGGGGYL